MSTSPCLINAASSACVNSTSAALSTAGIIGVAVGGFVFLLLIIVFIICICCCCCGCKKSITSGTQNAVIHPGPYNPELSVVTVSSNERFKPQYVPPQTYNPQPATIRKPPVMIIRPKPPESRPDSFRPPPSAPTEVIPSPQVTDPPSYELSDNREPVPDIPNSTRESSSYSAPQPADIVENVEDYNYDQ